jgi:hypothetical protein
MATDFNEEDYGQRWQSETVMFMLKQHQGEALGARQYHSRRREMALRCITHNIMILYVQQAFLQGRSGVDFLMGIPFAVGFGGVVCFARPCV